MITIRKLGPEDRAAVYEILQQTDMFTMAEVNVAMELIDTYLFNKDQKDYLVYAAVAEGGQVVGYVCFGPTPATEGTFDLYWIAVAPAMQNKGVGKQLLQFVEEYVKSQSGRLIIIDTSSQKKYLPTQQFYLRNNYTVEARIKDFYRPGDDRLIFAKRLNATPEGGQTPHGRLAATTTAEHHQR
ncbi:MAG: GNAT family N-acetyltransferase [bacterium]|jgi:ribosomal protein S18 acetylase RimI-like enzyme|nr:GNAT family N-acetyltransferase [candidate division KSB1 bacterium]MDH7561370.1 GNAT family N-acetyltransferase [bacterium]